MPDRVMVRFAFAISMSLVVSGCEALLYDSGPHPRWPRYAMAFANDTDRDMHDVRAEWSLKGHIYVSRAGYLSVGAQSRDNEEMDPIPPAVTVYWTTPDNVEHHQPLDVAARIRNITWFSGTIWFKFDDNHVELLTTGPDEPWLTLKHHL